MHLAKYLQDLFGENHKPQWEKSKVELSKWRHVPCSWIGRLNIIQDQFSSTYSSGSTYSQLRCRWRILWISMNWSSSFYGEAKEPEWLLQHLKGKAEGMTLPAVHINYEAVVTKGVRSWWEINGAEARGPKYKHSHWNLMKKQKQCNAVKASLSTDPAGQLESSYQKRRPQTHFIPFIKTQSKRIIDLNINYKTPRRSHRKKT